MDYIGEHLMPGRIGHFLILFSFVSSLVAAIAYFKSANSTIPAEASSWKRMGRIAFILDALSVLSIFGMLIYIVASHRFEYYYAWNHSSKALDFNYLLSCIWEGQEGSFLLWTIWHAVLGGILIKTARQWEAPVMTVFSLVQMCLATMIMGIYIFGVKIGSNPFLLTREFYQDAPLFSRADYLMLPQMQDGQGLNQLLQNYWMVIHPPVLFLGFASTLVPFAFAIGGLWKNNHVGWTKAALPWTLFSACALGTGIMMGAAWAYESLTFGGYWAWDPVENASLVPWLVLIAGLHTLVVYNATGHSLRATYLFFILTFILILYSTYLTRSGDLQDTSVHAFTSAGMNWQLRVFVLIFLVPSLLLFAKRYKSIPFIAKEENTYSREFWMFIGSLVFFLSAMFILVATSLPVINKIFNTSFAMGNEAEFAYNRVQIFVAVLIGILTAITQYLKYRDTPRKYLVKKIAWPTIIAVVLSSLISIFGEINYDKFGPGFLAAIHLALFSAMYAVVSNAMYIWAGLNGKLKAAGASVAHFGFGLMLVGILISSSKKQVLSYNTTGINLQFAPEQKENPLENITLLKSIETDMGKYNATFVNSDSTNSTGSIMYFRINFKNKKNQKEFSLFPNLIKNTKGQEGYSHNPDNKHYWNKDIFTYINYADNMDKEADTTMFKSYALDVNDTIFYSNGYMILNKVVPNPSNDKYKFTPSDTALMADISIVTKEGLRYPARPVFYVEDNQARYVVDTIYAQNLAVGFSRILNNRKIEVQVKESEKLVPFVALKVYEFPFINVLWLGTLVMIVGFVMSIVRRVKLNKVLRAAV
ncbi:MAG TPA: cytochrome c biogenesis protein CcsA [Chitinophagaceae bacterium]|nr:cytochrome c biogenesis protein CcsA [Chitinophagaceae bacterium]